MGKLKDDEIRRIVSRATMFQKFYGSSNQLSSPKLEQTYPHLFQITDSLNLDKGFVCEALLEYQGIPVEEPIALEAGFNNARILGFSSGDLDPETIKELNAQIEYHFNTMGEVKHRKGKIKWKAKPTGLSRFFASQNSPEVLIDGTGASLKITASQSMKTMNKFFLPSLAGYFAAFMMFAAAVFDAAGNDSEGLLVGSVFFFGFTTLYTRFISGRKKKKKAKLADLVEQLQLIFERRKRMSVATETVSESSKIEIPENEYSGTEEIEIKESEGSKEQA